MRLEEAVSKSILAGYGLPSPEGRRCTTAEQARAAATELGGPVYVKAQIAFGDRERLGLVSRVEQPDAAAQTAAGMLGRPVDAMTVNAVLVEAAVDPEQVLYISAHVDDEAGARVLRIGLNGGGGYRPSDAEIQAPIPFAGFETFEVRKLLGSVGVRGRMREAVTAAAVAVVSAARQWHAYTVEVNPLFITQSGPVAVDAKMELDDYSLRAVPDPKLVPEQSDTPREREARRFQQQDHRGSFRFVQLVDESAPAREGHAGRVVGSHSVGGGESLVVFDALDSVGLRPANYCDTSGAPSKEKVAFATQLIASQPHIAGYFFSSCIANQPLSVTAAGLVEGFEAARWRGPTVVRIAGNQDAEARAMVEKWAEQAGVQATVLGREDDEWHAARALADLLDSQGG